MLLLQRHQNESIVIHKAGHYGTDERLWQDGVTECHRCDDQSLHPNRKDYT